MTSTPKLNASSPEIQNFMDAIKTPRRKRAVTRSKYIAVDQDSGPDSWSALYLIDRLTHDVYTTKGYGVRGNRIGDLECVTAGLSA